MEDIVFVNGLVKREPEYWQMFKNRTGQYRRVFDESVDTLREEFDLKGTKMDVNQERRDELFKALCIDLKKDKSSALRCYLNLPDNKRPRFQKWLSVKTIDILYDRIVNVTQEQLVKNLIDKKDLTTKVFFYGYKKNLSILPSIISYLNKRGLLKVVKPEDISTISYSLFIERVNSFMQNCSLISYFYSQHFFDDAVDEYFGTDRHDLYKFLDYNNLSERDDASDSLLQEERSLDITSENDKKEDSENDAENEPGDESEIESGQSISESSDERERKEPSNISLGADDFVSEDVEIEKISEHNSAKKKERIDENSYHSIIPTSRMKTDYNDKIFYSMVQDESDNASLDADANKKIRDLVYQKMIDDGQSITVEIMKKHYEGEYGYPVLAGMFNMTEGAIRTRISRGWVEFNSHLNNCPKDMRIDIVKQVLKK